ncbi:MAG: glycosyltransferase [Deltaproteobacteria bacterium]|nr:glycosyltransferase [Deltaproteobacteria bacterium]
MNSTVGTLKKGNLLYQNKNYSGAIKEYLRLISGEPNALSKQARFNLGLVSRHASRHVKMLPIVRLLGEHPDNGSAYTDDKVAAFVVPRESSFQSEVRTINRLALSYPAQRVQTLSFNIEESIFCGLHNFYWGSSFEILDETSSCRFPLWLNESFRLEQYGKLLHECIAILKNVSREDHFLDLYEQQATPLDQIDELIQNYCGKNRSVLDVVSGNQDVPNEITVVIPNFNGPQAISNSLASILRHINHSQIKVEVIVVESMQSENSEFIVRKFLKQLDVKQVFESENCSFFGCCNRGARQAAHSNLMFVDSNIVFLSDSLAESLKLLNGDSVGAVVPNLSGEVIRNGIELFCGPLGEEVELSRKVDFSSTAGFHLVCRKSDFFSLGGFNEISFDGFNDVDFCLRMKSFLHKKSIGSKNAELLVQVANTHSSDGSINNSSLSSLGFRLFYSKWSEHLISTSLESSSSTFVDFQRTLIEKYDYHELVSGERSVTADTWQDIQGRSMGDLEGLSFRKEHIGNGIIKFWVAPSIHAGFDGLVANLIVDGALLDTLLLERGRPDVERALKRPAGEILFTFPHQCSDGEIHSLRIILEQNGCFRTIFSESYREDCKWLREAKEAKKQKKPVVFFASHNLKVQGAQTSLFQTVIGLKQSSDIYPVVFSPEDGPLSEAYKDKGIVVIIQSYPGVRGTNEELWRVEMSSFIACMKRLSPQMIVANTLQSFHTAIAGLALNIPTVLVPRESEPPQSYFSFLPNFIRPYADSLVSCVDQTVFVADATRKLWQDQRNSKNHMVIYNGLATSQLEQKLAGVTRDTARLSLGLKPDDSVILNVGTVCERKGQLDLLEAAPHLLEGYNGTSIKIIIVGMTDNDYCNAMQEALERLPEHIQNNVMLLPHTKSEGDCMVQQLYLASDLFVMSSRFESYPRVVLEALYFGLPVISTACFGVKEQIEDGKSGFFYEAGNYFELSKKIKHLIDDKVRLRQASKHAYERYNALTSYEQMVAGYRDLIKRYME